MRPAGGRPRALVVHTGGIGDFILTLPALACLAGEADLDILGRMGRIRLAQAAGAAQAVYDIESSGFETLFSRPDARIRALLGRYSQLIAWMKDAGELEAAVRQCGVDRVACYAGLPTPEWRSHASSYYAQALGYEIPEPEAYPTPLLKLAPEASSADIVIHPGSGGQRKNWPMDNFLAVAQALERRGRKVTWCLGPAEEEALRELPAGRTLRIEDLTALANRLASARLFIGNDCGISHLAAAAGCRVIALFGPTDPRVWRPLGPRVTVLEGVPWPSVEAVLDAVSVTAGSRR